MRPERVRNDRPVPYLSFSSDNSSYYPLNIIPLATLSITQSAAFIRESNHYWWTLALFSGYTRRERNNRNLHRQREMATHRWRKLSVTFSAVRGVCSRFAGVRPFAVATEKHFVCVLVFCEIKSKCSSYGCILY